MKVDIVKRITTNEGKKFFIYDDVYFYLNRNDKTYKCFGEIIDIDERTFKIHKVEIDDMHVSDELIIKYSEVDKGAMHHTDWW